MRTIYTSGILTVMRALAEWARPGEDDQTIGSETRKHIAETFSSYTDNFIHLGFAASNATIGKIVKVVEKDDCTWGDLKEFATELRDRLIDETNSREFFTMTMVEAELFENPRKGWELSIARFPTIVDDVEEASKCYAMSRYPASVFHSVQIVEAGLVELGKFLKVTDPHSGWTAVSGALKRVIDKKHTDRTSFEKRNFPFLEQLQGTVESLKNAWRNKISHSEGKLRVMSGEFSPDVAEEIRIATRAFMRRLAEGLPAAKEKKAASSAKRSA